MTIGMVPPQAKVAFSVWLARVFLKSASTALVAIWAKDGVSLLLVEWSGFISS